MRIVGRVKIYKKKNRLLAEDFLGSHAVKAIVCLGCMPGEPEPVSTPPRVRHRSKTMTSASVRPPALRKPKDSQDKEKERGRDKERHGKEKERGRDKERRQDKERGREKERHQGKGQDKRKAQSEDPKKGKAVVELMATAKKSKKEKEKKTAKVGKGEREAVETKTAEEKKKVEASKTAETKTDETKTDETAVAKAPKNKRVEKKSKKEKKDGKKKDGKKKETGEEQKGGGETDLKRKKSPEPKIKFVPAQAPKIRHIFETPERKKPRETSPHVSFRQQQHFDQQAESRTEAPGAHSPSELF